MSDTTNSARTLRQIADEAKLTGKIKQTFWRQCLLCMIPFVILSWIPVIGTYVYPASSLGNFIKDIHTQDNVSKMPKMLTKLSVQTSHVSKTSLQSSHKWKFTIDKSSGLLTYRQFVGPEHMKGPAQY